MTLMKEQLRQGRIWLEHPRSIRGLWRVGQLLRNTISAIDQRAVVYGIVGPVARRLGIDSDTARRCIRLALWPKADVALAEAGSVPIRTLLASLALDGRPRAVARRRQLLQRLADKKIGGDDFNRELQDLLYQCRRGKTKNAAVELSQARSFVRRRTETIITRLESARVTLGRIGTPGQQRNIKALRRLAGELGDRVRRHP